MYVIEVNQPGIPYASYVWGVRFTTDPGTATRFETISSVSEALDAVGRSLHVEASVRIRGGQA